MDTFKTGLSRARLKRERRIKNAILTILCMTHRDIAKRGGRETTVLSNKHQIRCVIVSLSCLGGL